MTKLMEVVNAKRSYYESIGYTFEMMTSSEHEVKFAILKDDIINNSTFVIYEQDGLLMEQHIGHTKGCIWTKPEQIGYSN